MANVLVSTFGTTWAIAAELVAFSTFNSGMNILARNKSIQRFYKEHPKIKSFDEIWLICTHGEYAYKAIEKFYEWLGYIDGLVELPEIKLLSLEKIEDLTSEEECRQMSDFIYRVVLQALEYSSNGHLVLSLAGGRKTMSSDMQRAADLFGCDALIHMASNNFPKIEPSDFTEELDEKTANELFIVEVQKSSSYNTILDIEPRIISKDYPIEFSRNNKISQNLYDVISERLLKAESIQYNAYRYRTSQSNQSIFHGLHQLPPLTLYALEEDKPTVEWIKSLPKADLHCHFGGILDVKGLVKVALANKLSIENHKKNNKKFAEWILEINNLVESHSDEKLRELIIDKNKLRNKFLDIPQAITVSAYITAFKSNTDYLDQLIYGPYLEENNFRNIGINEYEKLGDLQGSALLQTKESIAAACEYLIDYCREHNIKYLELRCSPCNYIYGGLTEDEVVEIMHQNLKNQNECDIRIIIIGSRHGEMNVFQKHVSLAQRLIRNEELRNFLVGFDVAGDENKAKPAQLRKHLLPLMKECMSLTIHAGENQPVENIWEAVYELNTDRVGHGLTLVNNNELLRRFRDRNIVIELCPSSNFQICDYDEDQKTYPLRKYMTEGLKVTLNTDNPGISRTSITNEYFFMAEYAKLTKLEIIQLLRNSFQGVFLSKNEKKQLIVKVEDELYRLISTEYNK